MEMIIDIFKKLKVDETIFHQFVIFLILFVVLKYLFFNKLQFVLELRESKTTKLEDTADKKFQEAEKLASEYDEKLKTVTSQTMNTYNSEKNAAISSQKQKVKAKATELEEKIAKERSAFEVELSQKKEEVLKNADSLSEELVGKILN